MKFLHFTIQTNKFIEEISFYEKYVGLTIQQDMRPMGKNMVFLANETGETNIEIIENLEATNIENENLSIGFQTPNVEEKRKELEKAGFKVTPMITPMPNVKFFFVYDFVGMKVQFM